MADKSVLIRKCASVPSARLWLDATERVTTSCSRCFSLQVQEKTFHHCRRFVALFSLLKRQQLISFLSPAAAEIVTWHVPGDSQADGKLILSFLQLYWPRVPRFWAAVAQIGAEPLDSRHICKTENWPVFHLPPHSNQQNLTTILTKRRQSGDLWHRPYKFGVAKDTRDVLSLIRGSREEVRARLCAWVCFVVSLLLSVGVQHQRDVGVGSPPRRNAGDHPELTSSFLYHFCFNGYIWCHCRVEEKCYTFTQTNDFTSKFKSQSHSEALYDLLFLSSNSQNRMIWILSKYGSWGASVGIFWKVLTRAYHWSHLLARAAAKSRCLAQLLPLEPMPESALKLLIRGDQPISKCNKAGVL